MAAEIIPISTQDYFLQDYNPQETNLIPSFDINTVLTENSYIEYYVYDNNQNIIYSTYNFSEYTVLANGQSAGSNNEISQIIVDPENSLITSGFTEGEYVTYFNFFNKKIGSNLEQLYIAEISSDRTELRLDSTVLTEYEIIDKTTNFVIERDISPYFLDFYLNFGNNQLVIANNILLDNQDPTNPTILVKLYEALPENFDLNSTLWIVTLVEESVAYQVSFPIVPVEIIDTIPLNGPNFNLDLKDQINNSTVSLNYTSLTTTALTSSQNQLKSLLEEKGLDINIDYSDFRNYVHFSSAQIRLENFYYKIQLIEEYTDNINLLNSTTNSPTYVSSSAAVYEAKINDIITYFDDYEYFLYYGDNSYAWPKTNNQKPYILASSDSNEVLTWIGSTNESSPYYGGLLLSASLYDNDNKDYLLYTIPEYLRDDPQNQPYETFVQMVAQLYDSIWVYYKDVISKYNNDNRLEYGVSKDIVADAIRDFGIKLYQNNFSNDDLYTAFLGLTPEGGLFPFPNITGSLPTPSGFEYVNTLISASNDYMPLDDVNKSLYKRIYHNLPYLLKTKGTLPGLRTLITSYGIPDTVLRINEYGGKDKSNTNDWDYWQDTFNYAWYTPGNNRLFIDWALNSAWSSSNDVPSTIQFRFKTDGLSSSNISYSQSLWHIDGGVNISLIYTGSGYTSGSYSGSIIDPYYQYATLKFYSDWQNSPTRTASVYLPFYDGEWWSVMVTRNNNNFVLYAGNNVYEGGENGTELGFFVSSSLTDPTNKWAVTQPSIFSEQKIIGGSTHRAFTGSYQEIRYYNTVLSESVFKDYIMNPYSSEGNSLNSAPNQLVFRLPLGGELYTGSISIHPKITGSWVATSSFIGNSSGSFDSTPTYVSNTEYFFYDQPVVGIKNAISDKIRVENSIIPTGSVLSPFRSLAQNLAASQSYTANTNLLEVAFSPQDEINDDISSQIGYFNIGELIGDPRLRSSSATSYPDLDNLRNEYFEKYTSNYDLNDYIRLIKFFDNSLFKMIKDFVPARTSLASGVVIKQHLLERNKYPQPQTTIDSTIAYYGSGSQNNIPFVFQNIEVSGTVAPQWNDYNPGTIENFSGGTGGTFEIFNGVNTSPYGPNGTGPENVFGVTQSWNENIVTPLGIVNTVHDSQDEFYDGEFSGSVLTVTTQSLFTPYPSVFTNFYYKHVHYYPTTGQEQDSGIWNDLFLNPVTAPKNGELYLLSNKDNGTSTQYLKISKFDCSGSNISTTLEQINDVYIFNSNTNAGVYTKYEVAILNETPSYYLYDVLNDPPITTPLSPLIPNQVLNYRVSASSAASFIPPSTTIPTTFTLYGSTTGNTLDYFNSSSGIYTLDDTPNTVLLLTGSVTIGGTGTGKFNISLIRQGVSSTLETVNVNAGSSYRLSSSYYGLEGDQVYLSATRGTLSPIFSNGSLLVTQSRAVNTSSCLPVIFEPYITIPNYYSSDYNPLINNVFADRLSTTYQDVDYSTDIATPTNFGLLISGSALKAAVQDSNYSSKRVINPRYNGVKSTSQVLNQYTPGDSGTYGKLPTVESLKTMVAYCDDIGGWPPERMDASAAFVKYLIKSDGTVIIPNTSPNSLSENKGTFETGENVLVQYEGTGNQATPFRKVIRGGTRIEPILYTQYGHSPASWNVTMSFTTDFITSQAFVGSYIAKSAPSTTSAVITDGAFSGMNMNNNILSGSQASPWVNNYYTVNQDLIDENVTLIVGGEIQVGIITGAFGAQDHNVTIRLIRERGGVKNVLATQTKTINLPNFDDGGAVAWGSNSIEYIYPTFQLSVAIPPQNMLSGDRIYYDGAHITSTYGIIGSPSTNTVFTNKDTSYLFIGQSPVQTNTLAYSTGTNTLWGYPNNTKLYAITCSNTILNQLYDNGFLMQDISGSGFNPIILPWSIGYGDEFRFEGNEINTFAVKRVYDVNDTDSERISSTGSVEVHFNNNLPSQSINLDHFVIRRYVDEASQILIEGFKPLNSSGPYILRPEYIVPELDKGVDDFILILKEKGLI
jgi:hypothetical protein